MSDILKKYVPTPHPVLYSPTIEDIKRLVSEHGAEETARRLQLREDKIVAEKCDPYRHGYEPDHWKVADKLLIKHRELLINGGNRAGKTEYAAKRAINLLVARPESRVWCLHTTNMSSIQMQQNVMWKYMPPEYKMARKTKITNVAYTQKNGFSENTFVLPNKSQCFFMNYAQDKKVIEGGECDMIWCDELVPLDWIETLRYRLVTRNGVLLLTFTPVTGYSPVVKEYVSGSTFLTARKAELLADTINVPGLPKGTMPYTAKCHGKRGAVIWFHSDLNPYSDWASMKATLDGRGSYELKIRAYGWAESLQGSQFPKFGQHNVIAHDKIPTAGTNYMVVDPAGSRNWFMLWMRVDEQGRHYVYREWPDINVGEWALPSEKSDGKIGIGQRNGAGRGINDYKELIKDLEQKESMFARYIDPRAGATQAAGKEGGTSLMELLDSDPAPMYFEPAAGIRVDEGVGLINDWLAFNQNMPISIQNEPKLYVSDRCQNLIYSLREWTGTDGDKGATKDPIDCLRYLAVMDPQHHTNRSFAAVGGGSY
jgi:phage terminase large subunit-like protein